MKVSPAASVTPVTLGPELFHAATSTTQAVPGGHRARRLDRDALDRRRPGSPACWTNTGGAVVLGVTAFDGADAAADPAGLEAVTVNV